MFSNRNTPSLTLDMRIDHASPNKMHDGEAKQPHIWQIHSKCLPKQAAPKLSPDKQLAGVIKSGAVAARWESILGLLDSDAKGYDNSTCRHWRENPARVATTASPRNSPAQKSSDQVTRGSGGGSSSSSSSIASKSTLVSSASLENNTDPRSSLSQSIETSERSLFVSRPNSTSTNTSYNMRSSTSSSVNGYKEMRPIEASYHNYSILTKPQQCCRRVKEALYQSWDADRNAGGKKDEGIIFVLRRHPQYPEVLEVIDSEDKTVAYRKISRGGRSWRETFHDAARSSQQGRQNSEAIGCGSSSRTPVANNQISPASMCRTGSFVGTACWSMDSSTSQIRQLPPPLHAVEQQLQQLHLKSESLVSTSVATVSSGSWQQCQPEHPRAFDAGELWEITSPCPSSFPLHCRDARGVIGPIPLTAMVLDRHQFCYRFHLAGNKMRWLAKRQGQSMAGLQCYVRGTVVALLLFGGCSAEGTGPDLVSSTGRRESWCEVQHTEDSHLPRIVVLPEAFSKLEPIDSAVVESFVLFTGIEVLECFLYNTDMV